MDYSGKLASVVTTVVISISALGLGIGAMRLLREAEISTIDYRMRLRNRIVPASRRGDAGELILVAIDPTTESRYGRYGAGDWLSRGPFFDQLTLFRRCLRPSVLAYDILFKDLVGHETGAGQRRVVDSPDMLNAVSGSLRALAAGDIDAMPGPDLLRLNRLTMEQGNVLLADQLATIMVNKRFPVVLGCHARGGVLDPQSVAVPPWSSRDLVGDPASGTPPRMAYLKDLAIPADDIHFPRGDASAYPYAPNASTPGSEVLDYCYLGGINVPRDPDGVVRRVPLVLGLSAPASDGTPGGHFFVPSFSLMCVMLHMGIDPVALRPGVLDVALGRALTISPPGRDPIRVPIDDLGRLYLNFRAEFDEFDAISFASVAAGLDQRDAASLAELACRPAPAINGRIAVVGVTVTGQDVGSTPTESNVPLAYVQMTAISNMLSGQFMRPLTDGESIAVMAVLFALFTCLCMIFRAGGVATATPILALIYFALTYAGVHFGWVALPVLGPAVYLVVAGFSILLFRYTSEVMERRRIRGMFSRMVSGKVLDYLEANPDSFSLRGHVSETSVFFSDIEGFTTKSESLPPERVTELLNRYLTPVTDCVIANEGYVDKYVGDSMMAVWGAPFPDEMHAVRACRCALAQQDIVDALNEKIAHEYGFRLRVRMGINSGTVTAGNMGSEHRYQYTVIGDTVNFAARLEPANKEFGTAILIGEATYQAAQDWVEVRRVTRILVAGKADIVGVYELLGLMGEVDPVTLARCAQYEQALAFFESRDWQGCLRLLEGILEADDDGPSRFLYDLAQQYRRMPPPEDWRGEYIRVDKK